MILTTVYPNYLLRLPDKTARAAEYRKFVTDLAHAQSLAQSLAAAPQMMKEEVRT